MARRSDASRRLLRGRHIARKHRSFISVQRSRKNGESGFERQTRGPRKFERFQLAQPAQHAHEVAVSRSYDLVRRCRRWRRRRRRLGTCLTKHSCGRYLVHATARTNEWDPLGTERDAPKTWTILPRTGEPGSEKRIAMSRRASVHYQPANVQITAHLLHSARHSFNDTRTQERTAVNPHRASCHSFFLSLYFVSCIILSLFLTFLSIEKV